MNRRLVFVAMAVVLMLVGVGAFVLARASDRRSPAPDATLVGGPAAFDELAPPELGDAVLAAVAGWTELITLDERNPDDFNPYGVDEVRRWATGRLRDAMLQGLIELPDSEWRGVNTAVLVEDELIGFDLLTPNKLVALACIDMHYEAWLNGELEEVEQSVEAYGVTFVDTPEGWRVASFTTLGDCV